MPRPRFHNLITVILCAMFCLVTSHELCAQKILRIESASAGKTKRFVIGDELWVKNKDDDFYRHTNILDMDPDAKTISFSYGTEPLDNIEVIRSRQQVERAGKWRYRFGVLGSSTLIYTGVDRIYSGDWNKGALAIGGGILGLGLLIPPIIDGLSRDKLGRRKRLRILDISPPAPNYGL